MQVLIELLKSPATFDKVIRSFNIVCHHKAATLPNHSFSTTIKADKVLHIPHFAASFASTPFE